MKQTKTGHRIAVCLLAAVLLLALTELFFLFRRSVPAGVVEIRFLDVGQADATLIVSREGSLLIDAGDADESAYLWESIRRYLPLDCLVLTHAHSDHAGGAGYLLRKRAVQKLLLPAGADEDEEFTEILCDAEQAGIGVGYLSARDTFEVGEAHFTVLAPLTAGTDGNEDCLVLRMDHGAVSALFTADATEKSEAEQLATYTAEGRADLLDIDILKAGHHGSDSSTCADYLAALSPSAVYISCGLYNLYGHPGRQLLGRLEAAGLQVFRTDRDGTILVISDGTTFRTETQ